MFTFFCLMMFSET